MILKKLPKLEYCSHLKCLTLSNLVTTQIHDYLLRISTFVNTVNHALNFRFLINFLINRLFMHTVLLQKSILCLKQEVEEEEEFL